MFKIKKAILPVAGFGTRLLPATKAQPKEMLPVVDKPVIQYLVEEAVEAGIEEIIFVTGRGKTSIENHFDYSFELEYNLVEKEKHSLLHEVRKISDLAKFSYVRQRQPKGDGDALLCASHLINEPVLVIFGDCLYDSKIPTTKQIIEVYEKYHQSVIGLSEVAMDKVDRFGVIDGAEIEKNIYKIKNIIEKPNQEQAPSNLVAVGKYIVTPKIFEVLSKMDYDKTGEIRLADAFEIILSQGEEVYGKKLEGEWLDTGDKLSFIKATIKLALKRDDLKDELKKFIKSL